MTPTVLDGELEAGLAVALRTLRPVDGAPAGLRSRVEMIPERLASEPFLRRIVRGWPAAAAVAGLVAVAAIALLFVGLRPGLLDQATTGAQPPTRIPFDPTVEGPGLILSSNVPRTLLVVPGAVVLVALALAAVQLYRRRGIRGWLDILGLGLLGVVVAGAIGLATHPGFEWRGGSIAPVLGYGVQAEPPRGGDGVLVYYETANPGEPVIVLVTISNPGPLPIRLEGIVEEAGRAETALPRWTAMTTSKDPGTVPNSLSDLDAFQPKIVEPNEFLDVYLVSKAGPCAFGPSFTLAQSADLAMIVRDREISFGYSVLGLSSAAPYELPVNLAEPTRVNCSPQ